MHRRRVLNVNGGTSRALVLTFRTYTVRKVNRGVVEAARLTKCTGKPGTPPSMPKLKF